MKHKKVSNIRYGHNSLVAQIEKHAFTSTIFYGSEFVPILGTQHTYVRDKDVRFQQYAAQLIDN